MATPFLRGQLPMNILLFLVSLAFAGCGQPPIGGTSGVTTVLKKGQQLSNLTDDALTSIKKLTKGDKDESGISIIKNHISKEGEHVDAVLVFSENYRKQYDEWVAQMSELNKKYQRFKIDPYLGKKELAGIYNEADVITRKVVDAVSRQWDQTRKIVGSRDILVAIDGFESIDEGIAKINVEKFIEDYGSLDQKISGFKLRLIDRLLEGSVTRSMVRYKDSNKIFKANSVNLPRGAVRSFYHDLLVDKGIGAESVFADHLRRWTEIITAQKRYVAKLVHNNPLE